MDRKIVFAAMVLAVFAGCAGGGAEPDIKVSYPKVAHSMSMENALSVFMFVENNGNADDYLVSAKIKEMPDKMVEIHDVVDGTMVPIEKIKIPAGEVVELKMGSYHIMAMGVTEQVDSITVVLTFGKSGDIEVVAEVPEKEETGMDMGSTDMEETTEAMGGM